MSPYQSNLELGFKLEGCCKKGGLSHWVGLTGPLALSGVVMPTSAHMCLEMLEIFSSPPSRYVDVCCFSGCACFCSNSNGLKSWFRSSKCVIKCSLWTEDIEWYHNVSGPPPIHVLIHRLYMSAWKEGCHNFVAVWNKFFCLMCHWRKLY